MATVVEKSQTVRKQKKHGDAYKFLIAGPHSNDFGDEDGQKLEDMKREKARKQVEKEWEAYDEKTKASDELDAIIAAFEASKKEEAGSSSSAVAASSSSSTTPEVQILSQKSSVVKVGPSTMLKAAKEGDKEKIQSMLSSNRLLVHSKTRSGLGPEDVARNEGHTDLADWIVQQKSY